jgi:hypothetical protein
MGITPLQSMASKAQSLMDNSGCALCLNSR